MSKTIHCASCAEELKIYPKVIQNPQRVVYLIDLHKCELKIQELVEGSEVEAGANFTVVETTGRIASKESIVVEGSSITEERKKEEKEKSSSLQSAFDALLPKKTVKKSNGLGDAPELLNLDIGDKRDKDHLRKEKTSSAPAGVLAQMKHNTPSAPEGDITVEPEGGNE